MIAARIIWLEKEADRVNADHGVWCFHGTAIPLELQWLQGSWQIGLLHRTRRW
jgi:hypothetical protein